MAVVPRLPNALDASIQTYVNELNTLDAISFEFSFESI